MPQWPLLESPDKEWPRWTLGRVRAPAGTRALSPGKVKARGQLPNDFGKVGALGVSRHASAWC